jgi:hypothetical protein
MPGLVEQDDKAGVPELQRETAQRLQHEPSVRAVDDLLDTKLLAVGSHGSFALEPLEQPATPVLQRCYVTARGKVCLPQVRDDASKVDVDALGCEELVVHLVEPLLADHVSRTGTVLEEDPPEQCPKRLALAQLACFVHVRGRDVRHYGVKNLLELVERRLVLAQLDSRDEVMFLECLLAEPAQ